MWEREKCWLPAFSPFPIMFSTLSQTENTMLGTFNLSSENVLNLDQSKILLFGRLNLKAFSENKENVVSNTQFCPFEDKKKEGGGRQLVNSIFSFSLNDLFLFYFYILCKT